MEQNEARGCRARQEGALLLRYKAEQKAETCRLNESFSKLLRGGGAGGRSGGPCVYGCVLAVQLFVHLHQI